MTPAPSGPCKVGEYICDEDGNLYQCVGTTQTGPTVPPPSSTLPEAILLSIAQSLGALTSEMYALKAEIRDLREATEVISLTQDYDQSTGAIHITHVEQTPWYFEGYTVHLSAAPTTSENLTLKMHHKKGAYHVTLVDSVDLSLSRKSDYYFLVENGPLRLEPGDAIDIDWVNSDARTWGLRLMAFKYGVVI
jgi:hypothetical protein